MLHQVTFSALKRSGINPLVALDALTVDSGRAGLHFSIFVVLLVMALVAYLGIGSFAGLLGVVLIISILWRRKY